MKYTQSTTFAGASGGTRLILSALAVAGMSTLSSTAGLLLDPGNHVLLPNQAGQTIELTLINDGNSGISFDTFNLFVVVGDGGPALGGVPVPTITGYDLHTDTPFESNFTPEVDQGSADGFAQGFITTQTGSVSAAPGSHTLATLTIDTTGFTTSDGPWSLEAAANILGFGFITSEFVLGGNTIPVEILSGSITLGTPVPEPSEMAIAAGIGLAAFSLWRRFRKA